MHHSSFLVIQKVGYVGIFVMYKFENKLNREINYFNFNLKNYDKFKFAIKTDSALNCFQFISIRSCTKMSTLPTLCIIEKLYSIVRRFALELFV